MQRTSWRFRGMQCAIVLLGLGAACWAGLGGCRSRMSEADLLSAVSSAAATTQGLPVVIALSGSSLAGEQLTFAIVGFFIVFGAYWIVQIVGIMFGKGITSGFN